MGYIQHLLGLRMGSTALVARRASLRKHVR